MTVVRMAVFMRRIATLLGVILLAACHFSCGFLPSEGRGNIVTPTPIYELPQDFFPLTIGDSWTYEVTYTSDFSDSATIFQYVSTNVADTIVDGFDAVLREYVYDYGQESSAFFALIGDSIRRRYGENDWDVLLPVNLIPNSGLGDTLWADSAGQNLATWVVLRTDTVVTTPAGTFSPCRYVRYQNVDTLSGEVWYSEDYIYRFGIGLIHMFRETNGVNRTEYVLQDYDVH